MRVVTLSQDAGLDEWRPIARGLLATQVPPDHVIWTAEQSPSLFAELEASPQTATATGVPRGFLDLAEKGLLHRDPERFALFYRLLWRLQRTPALLRDASDLDVARAEALARSVRRDMHKMTAFVRFREVEAAGRALFVAWYEPDHSIVEATAPFFADRFGAMDWSILTPDRSAHWRAGELSFGPGADRRDAPSEDAREEDWRTYYASIFNPARLKLKAMTREMPKRRWRNLPEADLIAELSRSASVRANTMIEKHPEAPRKRQNDRSALVGSPELAPVAAQSCPPACLTQINDALDGCRACPLWAGGTQAVPGEGAAGARLMLVGEQPGDQEDIARRPFIGPAGQVLDRALAAAGVDRGETYVTNAVKHFKNEPRGKRRLHKKPNAAEIERCRWWLEQEIRLVQPRVIVALGATAALSVLGHKGTLTEVRGKAATAPSGQAAFVTVHPSYLLRLPDETAKAREFDAFVADLVAAKSLAA